MKTALLIQILCVTQKEALSLEIDVCELEWDTHTTENCLLSVSCS